MAKDGARTFREFLELCEAPFQIYGPDPHGPSDAEPQPLGGPYKNKKRANTRADKLNQEIGGYRHFVRFVPNQEQREETTLTKERALEALRKYKIAKTKKIPPEQPPLRRGEVRTFNRTTEKWESNLDK